MIIEPKIRGFICTTAHPDGCAQRVQEEIDYVQSKPPLTHGPKKVLVIGASTGYGLASRIAVAFGGSEAATIGVFFEKEPVGKRTGTAGWYNSVAFEAKATAVGLYAKSFNGDAFSDEMRQQVIKTIKEDWGGVDLVIYSVASPRRVHPKTGEIFKSVLKPIGKSFDSQTLNVTTNEIEMVHLEQATEKEIEDTVTVMGGEDWALWIEALQQEGLLLEGATTVAYSYVGPEITRAVYRQGTIGRAKEHLEATAKTLHAKLQPIHGQAFVAVNKALVTQSSSAIPVIPLYFVLLNKVMKEKGNYEGCIEQMVRLFWDRLGAKGAVPLDADGLIRMDDWETQADVQEEVVKRWQMMNNENLHKIADIKGYHAEFLRLFGFGVAGVDYTADVAIDPPLLSAVS